MTPAQAAEEERVERIRNWLAGIPPSNAPMLPRDAARYLLSLLNSARRERDEARAKVAGLQARVDEYRAALASKDKGAMQPNPKFCHHPEKCRGLGACPLEYACND